jgi:glutamine synthetase
MAEPARGMLGLDDLAACAASGEIDTVVTGFTDHHGRLCGKRFAADFFLDHVAAEGTHGCDYLLTTDLEMEPVAGYAFAGWDLGYGDVHLVPDLATLRTAAWLDRSALVLCDVHHPITHERTDVAPRSILRRQVDALAATGGTAMAATELEHYLYRTSYRDAARSGYTDLEPAGWSLEDYQLQQGSRTEDVHAAIRRHLAASGVPVESSKGEWGLGQHEVNVRYAEVLEAADRHVVFKQCVKETADRVGASASFMAKPHADRAGSSCHVHLSLWQDGQSAFAGDEDLGIPQVRGSRELRWFLGGCLRWIPELVVLLAPTVNSYKRFADGSWAPTRVAWSYDNRTAGFRLVGAGPSLRIECRIPGADCNPYLALAALLACGRAGIAEQVDPPPPFVGDVYGATSLTPLPRSLRDAVDAFDASATARALLGDEVVTHYTHAFRTEQAAFDAAVTDWERQRYFERI